MDDLTEKILTRDSLAETERLLGGKHWSQFNEVENMIALSGAVFDGEIKTNHLKALGDTYFNMKWEEFKNLLGNRGFINALTYDFQYEDRIEEALLYYNPQKGLIVWATSYGNKDHANGGHLYGEIKANNKEGENLICRWLSTGGCIDKENRIYETQQDISEGLFSKLDTLESVGKWMPKWTNKNRFLWFADYVEQKQTGFDYKAITAEKIRRCPEALRKILNT